MASARVSIRSAADVAMSRERVNLPGSRSKPPDNAVTGGPLSTALGDRLAFERLLADLSARFADVPGDQVTGEIERALRVLVEFFDYDRVAFGELTVDGTLNVLAAAAVPGVATIALGRFGVEMSWLLGEFRAGRIVNLPSLPDDLPAHATAEAEFCRKAGLRSHLSIPLRVAGRVSGVLAFGGLRQAQAWPVAVVTRLSIIGEVFAGAVARARAEEELHRLRSRLWHADRVARTGALAAAIAHELNQPLAAILSNAQAALNYLDGRAEPETELRAALEAVVRDDKRAADTIRSLRAFLRRGETEHVHIDLGVVAHDVLQMLQPELRRQGIRVEVSRSRPCWVMADKVQMEQVVLNLMLNAAAAMRSTPREERTLALSASPTPGGAAQLSVRDSGTGIPAEQLERVFEPFWTTRQDGLGLGLTICRSIVEAHGGEIEAVPNGDRGVTFRVTLPAAPRLASAIGEDRDALEREDGRAARAASVPVVLAVVDDDRAVRESLGRLLSTAGWAVRTFASAEELLAEGGGTDFACLLLDLRMGGRSGLELYEQLRGEGFAPPAVFLSGEGDIAASVEAMKLGAVEFLEKPVDREQLFAAVRKALELRARQQTRLLHRDAARARLTRLSPREREVVTHVIRGRLNKQIAAALGISEQTVKQHRGRVMEKAEVHSVADLVRLCEASGLFDAP
jgi:FixJ family two-component response regulator/signal transduction histidine kinase